MDIDWSKAPEGATGYAPKVERWENPLWYKKDSEGVLYFTNAAEAGPWQKSNCPPDNIIWRKEWPEEGLPPVGTVCEFKSAGHHSDPEYQWCIYHGLMSCGGYIVEYHHHTSPGMTTCAPFDPALTSFRPIRTPEQIAAEEREKAIDEMAAIYKSNYEGHVKDGCQALYDAGYRKFEIVESE